MEINSILQHIKVLFLGFSIGVLFGMYLSKKSIEKYFKNKD